MKGKGFPCFVSSEQDGTGKALDVALALSRAIGATKAGAIASSVREETAMDLFAEQALWPNIIMLFRSVKGPGSRRRLLTYSDWSQGSFQCPEGGRLLRRGPLLRDVRASIQCVDCHSTFRSRWMSKEPAEIFERAAEDGFILQVHISVSFY